MVIHRRRLGRSCVAIAGTVAILAGAGSAFALQGLPPGGQVNDDPAAGIDPALGVSGEEPANADVVGGALTTGKVAVPWAVFRQLEASATDQIFSRSFAGGAWTTRGIGTVGGSSSAAPTFSGSLNFDQTEDGEAPAIDFAGAARTVPWVTWYENTSGAGFASNNIFASRFDATQNKWVFAGQGRGIGGASNVQVPSLNIHTDQDAENPSVAGGTTTPGGNPGPWITWQETSASGAHSDQIFVSRPEPGQANCDAFTPAGVVDGTGHVLATGGFCWQETGNDRVAGDPSLNVDPARNGIEPDIAFTGSGDNVPWVVWYETGTPGAGLQGPNGMVFAAKGVAASGVGVEGGLAWTAVGNGGQGTLDATVNGAGTCAHSITEEKACALNADPTADAEDPRVAAGTMSSANPTVPWVTWDENVGGHRQVFVSRLTGAGAAARFALVNNGQPISVGAGESSWPDITFSGDTPYVSWREDNGGGVETAFVGHFVDAADPTFVLDSSNTSLAPASTMADVREPISSGCTANPLDGDGATCQGGAVGTPFFLFTNGTSPLSLNADAYQPDAPVTGAASGVGQSTATVSASVNPQGARASVAFQFGTTTAYGQSTPAQTTGPDNGADAFSATLSGLPAGTTIHYRAVATSDFATVLGADQTLTTALPPQPVPPLLLGGGSVLPGKTSVLAGNASVGSARVSGTMASIPITCKGVTSCTVSLELTVTETLRGHRVLAVGARKTKVTHRTVVVGTARATVKAGQEQTVRIGLNRTGRNLLAARHRLATKLTVTQRIADRNLVIFTQTVTFKARKHWGH
jgi:hypothetical protein